MQKLYFLLITIICFLSCKHKFISAQVDSSFYKNFDLVNLKGKDKIEIKGNKLIEYPYVQVIQKKNKKVINFNYSRNMNFSREYLKKDSFWTYDYVVEESREDCTYYHYQFFANNSMVEVQYCGNPKSKDFYLSYVSKRTKGNYETYRFSRFDKKITIQPSYDIQRFPLEKAHSKEEGNFEEKEAVIIYKSKNTNWRNKEVLYENTSCYAKNGLGFIWWYFWWHKFQETDCSYYD